MTNESTDEVLTDEALQEKWAKFFENRNYTSKIISIADSSDIKAIEIDYWDIDRFDGELSRILLEQPSNVIYLAERAIQNILPIDLIEKRIKIELRIKKLPEICRVPINEIRAAHLNKFITIKGRIKRVTETRPRLVDAIFKCKRCTQITPIHQPDIFLQEPLECSKENKGCGRSASSTSFELLKEASTWTDYQKIVVEEYPESTKHFQPQDLHCSLYNELTGMQPIPSITLNGILMERQRRAQNMKQTIFDIYMDVNSIEFEDYFSEKIQLTDEVIKKCKHEASHQDLFSRLISSIAPTIRGYETIKFASLLQLFGGVERTMPDGTYIRGNSHILLLGEYATAKSQILRSIAAMAPIGLFIGGEGASGVGLTFAFKKDEIDKVWTIDLGALPLCHNGIACVDEFDKMKTEDRNRIHGGMEQQEFHYAKAGLMGKINSKTAVLAGANPKTGRFDKDDSVTNQTDLSIALLSRFDLIFTIRDIPNKKMDSEIARHILNARTDPELVTPYYDNNFMKQYVTYAKTLNPKLSNSAKKIIEEFYVETRQGNAIKEAGDSREQPLPFTARQLEGLIRFSEASARARLSKVVEDEDVDRAKNIFEYCLNEIGIDEQGRKDIDKIWGACQRVQHDRIKLELDLIQKGTDNLEDLINETGLSESIIKNDLEHLKKDGRIFERIKGKYTFLK